MQRKRSSTNRDKSASCCHRMRQRLRRRHPMTPMTVLFGQCPCLQESNVGHLAMLLLGEIFQNSCSRPFWMPELNLRSIEPLVTIPIVLVHPKCTQAKRRKQCLTAWKVTGLTRPCDAQSVRAGLVSSGIIRGERSFAPGSASIALRPAAKVTTIGWAGSKSLSTSRPKAARGRHDASEVTTR